MRTLAVLMILTSFLFANSVFAETPSQCSDQEVAKLSAKLNSHTVEELVSLLQTCPPGGNLLTLAKEPKKKFD
jgi:hypothetical protein